MRNVARREPVAKLISRGPAEKNTQSAAGKQRGRGQRILLDTASELLHGGLKSTLDALMVMVMD